MKLVSRKEWGARSARYVSKGDLNSASTGHWNGPKITVGGSEVWDHTKCAGLVRGIQNFHMDGRGWSDIAYNFVECPHGYTFEGRGINVINGANGTNAGNRSSHAVMCLAGEGNPFTDNEKVGFKDCVKYISDLSDAPNQAIGHRDHKSTECPGDSRYRWIHDGMPISGSSVINQRKKESGMEAALELIRTHYRNARGVNYNVATSDPKGYQHWTERLLDAYDKGQPLKPIADQCGGLLFLEMQRR